MKKLFTALVVVCTCCGCCGTRLYFGEAEPKTDYLQEVERRALVPHFVGGLVHLPSATMHVEDYVGEREDFVVKTNLSFFDAFLGNVTSGIYTPSQVKFYEAAPNVKEMKREAERDARKKSRKGGRS